MVAVAAASSCKMAAPKRPQRRTSSASTGGSNRIDGTDKEKADVGHLAQHRWAFSLVDHRACRATYKIKWMVERKSALLVHDDAADEDDEHHSGKR